MNWQIQKIPIKKLIDHPHNPRYITKEQSAHLENLLETYGLIEKPIVNLDMTIIGGHQRVKILKKMKVKEVECWVPERQLTDEEVNHLCIGLNLNQGQFDYDVLANAWEVTDLITWGFDAEKLLGDPGSDEDDEVKPKKKKKSDEDDEISSGEERKKGNKMCPSCGYEF